MSVVAAVKLIYTQENRFLVHNVQNIVENAGISTLLKNEYAGGAAGDLSPFDTWLELWVEDDADYDKAMEIVASLVQKDNEQDWVCSKCGETNPASFDVCWHCQSERP